MKLARELSKRQTGARFICSTSRPPACTSTMCASCWKCCTGSPIWATRSSSSSTIWTCSATPTGFSIWGRRAASDGGRVVAEGRPAKIAATPASYTGQFLARYYKSSNGQLEAANAEELFGHEAESASQLGESELGVSRLGGSELGANQLGAPSIPQHLAEWVGNHEPEPEKTAKKPAKSASNKRTAAKKTAAKKTAKKKSAPRRKKNGAAMSQIDDFENAPRDSEDSADESAVLKEHDFSRAENSPEKTETSPAEEILENECSLCQGTTLVVPQRGAVMKPGHWPLSGIFPEPSIISTASLEPPIFTYAAPVPPPSAHPPPRPSCAACGVSAGWLYLHDGVVGSGFIRLHFAASPRSIRSKPMSTTCWAARRFSIWPPSSSASSSFRSSGGRASLLAFNGAGERPWHWSWLLALIAVGCFGLAMLDEVLLPGPDHAPIEDLFRTPSAAWTMFFFGVTLAPFFEEIVLPRLPAALAGHGVGLDLSSASRINCPVRWTKTAIRNGR
jgi:hypothetical protein